jgi:hypothetical protein
MSVRVRKKFMNLFIIGSGFTKSIFPEAPLNNELLRAIDNGEIDCASRYLTEKYQTDDIEIALTKLDADIATSYYDNRQLYNELRNIRHKIEIDLGDYFTPYRATYELLDKATWLTDFMRYAIADGDIVVSLNYDCIFEGALDCIGKWSPKGGYGFFRNPLIDDSSFVASSITVLKIHGSTSFRIAAYPDKPHCRSINFVFDEWYFPKSAKNTHFGYGLGKGETYLIAPSYVKVPTVEITYFMIDALKAASESKDLVIIGCSLRPEDSFLILLITHFLRQPQWPSRKIVILDMMANEIAKKVKDYWGVNIEECVVPIEGRIENSVEGLRKILGKESKGGQDQ